MEIYHTCHIGCCITGFILASLELGRPSEGGTAASRPNFAMSIAALQLQHRERERDIYIYIYMYINFPTLRWVVAQPLF